MHTCSKCKQQKELSEFYFRDKNGNKPQAYCKSCFNKMCIERWIQRKKDAIEYLGGRCNLCLQTFPYFIYDFHHKDPKEKDVNWVKLRLRSWRKITEELDKCELLCSNCHRIVHHTRKIQGAEAPVLDQRE